MVSLIFEGIKDFIFTFPTRPPCSHKSINIFFCYFNRCRPAKVNSLYFRATLTFPLDEFFKVPETDDVTTLKNFIGVKKKRETQRGVGLGPQLDASVLGRVLSWCFMAREKGKWRTMIPMPTLQSLYSVGRSVSTLSSSHHTGQKALYSLLECRRPTRGNEVLKEVRRHSADCWSVSGSGSSLTLMGLKAEWR